MTISPGDDSLCSDCRSVLENKNGNMCIPTVDPASFQQRLVTLNMVCGDANILGASLFSLSFVHAILKSVRLGMHKFVNTWHAII